MVVISEVERTDPEDNTSGYIIKGRLPDRRLLYVSRLGYGRARLGISPPPPFQDVGVLADNWEFSNQVTAIAQFYIWNPAEQPEPDRWDRHLNTNRYRIDGLKWLEYVKFDPAGKIEDEIKRAVLVSENASLNITSVEEEITAWSTFLPGSARSYIVHSTHILDRESQQRCNHFTYVLVYGDRCVVLTYGDMLKFERGALPLETVLQRLIP